MWPLFIYLFLSVSVYTYIAVFMYIQTYVLLDMSSIAKSHGSHGKAFTWAWPGGGGGVHAILLLGVHVAGLLLKNLK